MKRWSAGRYDVGEKVDYFTRHERSDKKIYLINFRPEETEGRLIVMRDEERVERYTTEKSGYKMGDHGSF